MKAMTALVLALVLASSPARGDLILQSDFARQQTWDVSSCVQNGLSVACVGGTVARGLNTTTGLYGFAYEFSRFFGQSGTGLRVDGWVCQLQFLTPGATAFVFPGSVGFCTPLSSNGVFYAQQFNGQSILSTGFATWAYASPDIPEYRGEALARLSISEVSDIPRALTTITTPEPSTFLLVGAGLICLVATVHRRIGAI